jgi:sugar phosphate isomerase/epimerase
MRLWRISVVIILWLTIPCIQASAVEPTRSPIHIDHVGLKKLSWQLLCQTSIFHGPTITEIIDVLHTNGFHHLELSPTQLPVPDREHIGAINAKLKEAHLDIVSYGVADFGQNETDARKVFELGKSFEVKNIIAMPARESLEMLDKLAAEYNINVAILNQSESPPFADADALTQALKERSAHMGVCADITEWRRAGQDPLDCVRKLRGRILEVHLTDSNSPQETAAVSDVLKELVQQKFKGAFCVQTENGNGPELIKDLAVVVNSFSDVVTKLAVAAQ